MSPTPHEGTINAPLRTKCDHCGQPAMYTAHGTEPCYSERLCHPCLLARWTPSEIQRFTDLAKRMARAEEVSPWPT